MPWRGFRLRFWRRKLRKLCLVANCVEKIENLDTNVNLEHLEPLGALLKGLELVRLYQNLLKKIDNISHLHQLTVLDLSFNKIRSMEPLASCHFPQLKQLYLSSNKITDVEGPSVAHLNALKCCELLGGECCR